MIPQLLVNVVPVAALAAGASITLPHGLASGGVAVAPTLVFPDRVTPIIVAGVTPTTITFRNTGTGVETAKFRCERGWQPEVDASTVQPMLWQGNGAANEGLTTYTTASLASAGTVSGGWANYQDFEVTSGSPLDGKTGLTLVFSPSPFPQQHMVVRNGRIMRINRDYVIETNTIVLQRVLTEGEVVAVYYNRTSA